MKKKDNRSALKNIEILKNERRLLEAELTKRQDEYYALLKKYGKKPVYYAPDYDDMKEQGFGLDEKGRKKLLRLQEKNKQAERKLFPSVAAYERYSLYRASYDADGNFTYASDSSGQIGEAPELKRAKRKRELDAKYGQAPEEDTVPELERPSRAEMRRAKKIAKSYRKSGDPSPASQTEPLKNTGKTAIWGDVEIKLPYTMRRQRNRLIKAREKLNARAASAATPRKLRRVSAESRRLAKYEDSYRRRQEKYLRKRAKKLSARR